MVVVLVLTIAIMVMCVLDIITTEKVLRLGGKELNPVMAWCMVKLEKRWWIPKLAGTVAVIGILVWLPSLVGKVLGSGIVLMYIVIVWNNVRNIRRLKKEQSAG